MTVAQLLEELIKMPPNTVVLMDSDFGLSLVAEVDFIAGEEPGIPAEVILLPSMEE